MQFRRCCSVLRNFEFGIQSVVSGASINDQVFKQKKKNPRNGIHFSNSKAKLLKTNERGTQLTVHMPFHWNQKYAISAAEKNNNCGFIRFTVQPPPRLTALSQRDTAAPQIRLHAVLGLRWRGSLLDSIELMPISCSCNIVHEQLLMAQMWPRAV